MAPHSDIMLWSLAPCYPKFATRAKENKLPGGGRQVDAASMFSSYAHPTISVLALDWSQENGLPMTSLLRVGQL